MQRRAALAPVGQQLSQRARLDHRAGEDMGADLAALLDHADRAVGSELAQPDRGGQARGAGADNHHVEFHPLAGNWIGHCGPPFAGRWRSRRCYGGSGGCTEASVWR